MPLVIVAGEEDQLVDIEKQSARLRHEFSKVPCTASLERDMVHQTATEAVMGAINEAAQARKSEPNGLRQPPDVLGQGPLRRAS